MEHFQKIRIEFKDDLNQFKDFQMLFAGLNKLDAITEVYLTDIKHDDSKYKSEVTKISKNSPTWIEIFISEHWYETLLFAISQKSRIKNQVNKTYKKIDNLVHNIREQAERIEIKNLAITKEDIERFDEWYNNLSPSERMRINGLTGGAYYLIKQIVEITFL